MPDSMKTRAKKTTAKSKPKTQPNISTPEFGKPWKIPDIGMKFMPVEPGSFQMGADEVVNRAQPVHTVHITKPFWIGRYPVTQAEYEGLTGGHNPSYFEGDRNPVEQVRWYDAMEFCRKLTEQEREAGRLPGGYEYRLSTEAEWEYSARGGHKSRREYKYAGSDNIGSVAWYADNSRKKAHPVGQLDPNELGLHDMNGNVCEWCMDWYDADYYEKTKGAKDPFSNVEEKFRVLRGGAWGNRAKHCRSAHRSGHSPELTDYYLGFRVILGILR